MMKKIGLFLVIACLFSACGPQTNYTINGMAPGVEDGSAVVLASFADYKITPIDSTTVQNGSFTFQGNVAPDAYILRVDTLPSSFMFFITGEGETMNVTLNLENMLHSSITGSAVNEQYAAYAKGRDSLDGVIDELVRVYLQKEEELSKDKRIKEAEKKKLLAEAEKNVDAELEPVEAERKALTKSFVLDNVNNIAGQKTFLQERSAFNVDELGVLAANIKNKETETAQVIQERLTNLKSVVEGNPFVDVELAGVDDKPVKLSSVAGKGTYVLIDFWASWCGPCRRENPNVVALYKQYHDKGFDVVGISRDRAKEPWLKGIADDGLTWTHLWDKDGTACKLYVVDFIPTTFLLDKEGNVIARNLRGDELRNKLKELLGE